LAFPSGSPAYNPAPYKPPAPKPAPNPYLTDPGYLGAITQQKQQGQAIDQQTTDALSRLLVQYGDPNIANGLNLGPSVGAEASANTNAGISTLAQLNHQHDLNRRAVVNALAAHGILNSGDTGYRLGEEDRSYGIANANAHQSLMDAISQAQNQGLASKATLQNNVLAALENAFQNYITNPAFYGQAQK